MENTLFGEKIISSINFDEQEIIRDILYLHCNGNQIELDPTYSIGNFYKKGLQKPIYRFDKYPQLPEVKEAESHKLPLDDSSINVIMFDPPFLIGGSNYREQDEGSCIIAKRFTSFKTYEELRDMYIPSLKEFYRLLKHRGIVIFKCQDCICSAKQYFTHCMVNEEAVKIGFYAKDLFILLAKNRITDGRKQQHARKFHSYYWVFQKL